ncbi:MAG: Hsp70 family protein, partial [Planctomycetota bacterium]
DTFDAKILGLSGDNWLGGDDFDNRIVDRMVKILKEESGIDVSNSPKAKVKLKQKAEEAKINLSEAASTQVEFVGKLDGKLCQVEFSLTRSEYNQMIDELVARSIEKADEAIKQAELTRNDIDVILLVGGSTLTPCVQERLEQHFGKAPSKRVDPMLAVGLGAAICTRDVAWDDKSHRVILRSRAEVWPEESYTIRGRTSAGSRIEITGAAEPADSSADDQGEFSVEVKLKPNSINDVTVVATSPKGESAKAVQRIRQDVDSGGQDGVGIEPAAPPIIAPTLPRNILLGLKDDLVATVIRAGITLPNSYEDGDQFSCDANAIPFTLRGPVYEGAMPEHEIPHGPFNTHMGTLEIQCPPTTGRTPLVVSFEIDESRNLTFKCWFKEDPSVFNEITLRPQTLSRDKWHLLERADNAIKSGGERIRPDEKTKINHKKQALIDLCEQYWSIGEMDPQCESVRQRIMHTGNQLKSEVEAIERKYNL